MRKSANKRLAEWQTDSDLDSVRRQDGLDRLDEYERGAWRRLWQEVEGMRKQTEGKK